MSEHYLTPDEAIRERIRIRERRRNRLYSDVQTARDGLRAEVSPGSNDGDASSENENPEGASAGETAMSEPAIDLSDLTVAEMKEMLSARGIDFPANAKKADLIALLKQSA